MSRDHADREPSGAGDGGFASHFARCARLIQQADGLLITAGAGLGVDSGLPDFRGSDGMWRAYPALGEAGMSFREIANPRAFQTQPRLAWGFYGHRLNLYRATTPGATYAILKAIAERVPDGAHVFTSNVDGHFQRAGFDESRITECHGSIHHLQCMTPCGERIWSADAFSPQVDEAHCLLCNELPRCPHCGGLARPNILMFGDDRWIDTRLRAQLTRLETWRSQVDRLLVIEVGASMSLPTVRRFGEHQDAPIIRINPLEPKTSIDRGVSLPMRAIDALLGIATALSDGGFLEGPRMRGATGDLRQNPGRAR
jgi:NAD-dependent SIR2 family protein deacetylase